MNQIWRVLIFTTVLYSGLTLYCFATDMSQGLQCPPGWNDNVAARGNDLIKQCVSPSQDAFIELYAAPGAEVPLGKLLKIWASEMTKKGLPFQDFVSEQPGHVSGYPAVTRVYSGHTRNGAYFDSSLVASRYHGVNYIFQGLSLKGHEQARQQMRHAMNTWYYPGVSQQNNNSPYDTLPLGSGSTNTPYGNDPYGNTPQNFQVPTSIKVDRHGNGCDAMLKIYDNFGHHIMDYQSSYVGTHPFNDTQLGWDWTKKKYRNFFKITVHNYSDSEIRFVKLITNSYKPLTKYCTRPNGSKYPCGTSRVSTYIYNDIATAFEVDRRKTNVLLPGKSSVKQGSFWSSANDFRGKTNKYTYYFKYKGKTFSFEACRTYR
ncbi:hypothetical protein [Maridesulfovibrio zosterae]|uniref:hypothetical protein n=1 Tax=Maridesulfovibrio zosterae TaxID=82171 RepID=UPI0004280A9B|nr:hypothetical protein [Maridesulfovibrio zosterae]